MEEWFTFPSVAGPDLEGCLWLPDREPVGVVQIVHGMAEHIERYRDTALALNRAGYAVVGHSHLGHGHKAQLKGFFADKDGWDAIVEDVHTLRKRAQKRFAGLPCYLLGHSMGSFVVRTYCLRYESGLTGVILSGTGHFDRNTVNAGKSLAHLQCRAGGARKPARLVEKISSGKNNSRYTDVRTPFDWLSRDRAQVAKYITDPLCGFTFTASAYADMFDGLGRLYPESLGTMDKSVPVLLISGDMDPIGSWGKGVETVAQEYRDAGIQNVEVRLYPAARHELFNELNREEVWADLTAWLDSHR